MHIVKIGLCAQCAHLRPRPRVHAVRRAPCHSAVSRSCVPCHAPGRHVTCLGAVSRHKRPPTIRDTKNLIATHHCGQAARVRCHSPLRVGQIVSQHSAARPNMQARLCCALVHACALAVGIQSIISRPKLENGQ